VILICTREEIMIKTSLATAITVMAASAALPVPVLAQDDAEHQFGTVHFSTSCNETAQRRFDRGMRYQHSFWYRQSKEIFEETLKADPDCAIAYGELRSVCC
jgi:Tfp pilus assembly protein PilF